MLVKLTIGHLEQAQQDSRNSERETSKSGKRICFAHELPFSVANANRPISF